MRITITFLLTVMLSANTFAQKKYYDSIAILVIDRMSDVIGDMHSCNFRLSVSNDVVDASSSLIKQFTDYEVYMKAPNKMMINAKGVRGHRVMLYNGSQLAVYSFEENNYSIIPAADNIIKTIDSIYTNYGIEFPAADFFYPSFTDDLLEVSDSLIFLGIATIGGKEYFHIAAITKEKNFQIWVSNDAYALPARFVVTDKQDRRNPQYQAVFSEWQINGDLPEAMFNFLPPPGAARVKQLSKSESK